VSVFESIAIGEGWISEHFFASSGSGSFEARVKERLKEWDEQEGATGGSPRSRFAKARRELLAELAALEEDFEAGSGESNARAQELLLEVLGYVDGRGLKIAREGPLVKVAAPGVEAQAPLAVILANPVETADDLLAKNEPTLAVPVSLDQDGEQFTSAARLLSALFTADEPPAFALVLAGRIALLAEKARWAEGRYLAVSLQLVAERNDAKKGGEIDTALTCLEARSLIPDAEGGIWWERMLAESVKHTVGVSKDLRDGVRISIELLAQEVVDRRLAQGLEPLPPKDAQKLARQALRFLYRILFLLYAEASPELEVLPVGAPEYDQGYSLDRLRELVQVKLATPQAKAGTHLYDSLALLFRLVDQGHAPSGENDLVFNPLRADLFKPEATELIDEVGLGNEALQQVLAHLLLSKEQRGKDRGFISYAELGINQLGAVYEGLMSYTGFFAETDLYEVAKGGDSSKGSWVVPAGRSDGIAESDFVRRADPITGELKPVLHKRGSFVFRLAGRERQQSASYYTPEVLTKFTVRQALEELLDQDGPTPAAEILGLTVCEPALGSGAFAIEATRQLAERYLRRRQEELGERIDPDAYPRELQKAKAYIALHNVYGVDLNATAVELAEISLWLDTMVSGLAAPWFGLHLKRGNSLIGARRAVYSAAQVASKSWLGVPARDVPLTSLAADIEAGLTGSALDGAIHHFLVPAAGWGSAADAKEASNLAPDAVKALKAWRGAVKRKPSAKQVRALQDLARRVEQLWQFALQRLRLAEAQSRRAIQVWGAAGSPVGGAVQRETIEASLADAEGAFARLRRAMDAWCALWFWPLTSALATVAAHDAVQVVQPPTLDQWIAGLQAVLGLWRAEAKPRGKKWGQAESFASAAAWDELGLAEAFDRIEANLRPIAEAKAEHPWLEVAERIADGQGFFHWELDFATVFAQGGFDLQVGNPPWVRPRSDEAALLAEGDPWWQLNAKPSQEEIRIKRPETLAIDAIHDLVTDGMSDVAVAAAFMGAADPYPHLAGLQPDTYRCFMEQVWRHGSDNGKAALVHPETHFTDEKAGPLRQATYRRLRRHWQFINELKLFEEIHHLVTYGVHVYGSEQEPGFLTAASLYHPDTVDRSFNHDGSGDSPGLKDPDGHWDLRPHKSRIIHGSAETLKTWHDVVEEGRGTLEQTRMVYTVNVESEAVLGKLSQAARISALGLRFSRGWDESIDRKNGYFEIAWGPPASWDGVILKGPNLYIGNPFFKSPNPTMLHNQDYSLVDLEMLPPDAIAVTSYKPAGDKARYDAAYGDWGPPGGAPDPVRDHYRVAWREMAASTGARTLICALICPGTGHINAVASSDGVDMRLLPQIAGFASSLLADFLVRAVPKNHVNPTVFARTPFAPGHALMPLLTLRALRLNCLTDAYGELWAANWEDGFARDLWAGGRERGNRPGLAASSNVWSPAAPLRIAEDRRQALLEIDALVAVMLGVTADELCTVYRTQFPVLYGYDTRRDHYDANGRLVPGQIVKSWKAKGDAITQAERTATNQAGNTYTYELPFTTLNREADMRQAHAHFTRLAQERAS
jgi:hypothetical protein